MKKTVVFLTLLCVLLVFQGAFAATNPTVKESLEYNGEAQGLLESTGKVKTEGYDFYFCVADEENEDNCDTFSPDWIKSDQAMRNVTGIKVGKYFVYYQSYNAQEQLKGKVSGNFETEITPKTAGIKWTDPESGYEYDGNDKTPAAEATGIVETDTVTVKVTVTPANDVEAKIPASDAPQAVKVGKYLATAELDGKDKDNYELDETATKKFEITQKTVSITWTEPNSYIYDGTDKTPQAEVTGKVEGDDVTAKVTVKPANDAVEGKAADPEGAAQVTKDAGEYQAEATLDGADKDNYKLDETATKDFEITPKPVRVEWTDAEPLEYDGKDKTPTAKVNPEDLVQGDPVPEVTVSLAKPVAGDSEPEAVDKAINAGDYNAFATIQDPNYATAEDSAMHAFTIAPRVAEFEADPDEELIYDGTAKVPTVIITNAIEGDEYELTVTTSEEAIDADNYVATVTAIDNPNYALPEDPTVGFGILPADIDNYELTVLEKFTILNADGDIVAAGYWPFYREMVVNSTSPLNPYTFSIDDIEVSYRLADGTTTAVNVVIDPDHGTGVTQHEDGEYRVFLMPAATETNFFGEILIVWQIGRNPQPVNVFEDFFYIGPRHHHDASFCADRSL